MNDKLISTARGDVTQVAQAPKRPQSENSNSVYEIVIYMFGMNDPFIYFVRGITRIASIRGDFDAKKSQSYVFKSKYKEGTIGLNWANVAAVTIWHMPEYADNKDFLFLYLDKSDANGA